MNSSDYHRAFLWLLSCILLPAALLAQPFETRRLNNSPLYGTASVLQDYDDDGDLDVIVTRRSATYEPAPSSVELLENDGRANFSRRTLFSGDLVLPVDVDYGDVDGDGDIDYIVCDDKGPQGPGKLVLFENAGGGSFVQHIIQDSTEFDQAALADFDKDGDLDFVAVGFGQSVAAAYLNNGSLGFVRFVLADSLSQVTMVETGDIDDDNDEDVIIGGGRFRLLYNDGNAGFDSTKDLITYQNYNSSGGGIAIADLNNDGVKDMLAFARVGFGGLYFLDGANDFKDSEIDRAENEIDLGGDLVVFDIDGNGMLDIVRQNAPDSYIAILYQDSTVKFRREILERNWDNRGAGQMSVGDLDGDGDQDLFLAENGNIDGDVSWYENIGGKLYRHVLFGEIQSVSAVSFADMDRDGDQDILASAGSDLPGAGALESELFWYENKGEEPMREWRIDDNARFPADIAMVDLDGLGAELVAALNGDSSLVYYRNEHPDWTKVVVDSLLSPPLSFTIANIDGVNRFDIVLCETGKDLISVYRNDGSGQLTREELTSGIKQPVAVQVLDINNDQRRDLIVAAADTSNSVVLLINNGSGGYDLTILATGQRASDLVIADWDSDADPDLLVSFDRGIGGARRRDVALFMNQGSGSFTESDLYLAQERTRAMGIIDVDQDNDPDLIVGGKSVTVNDGFQLLTVEDDTVTSVLNLAQGVADIFAVDVADFDGDGIMEIVAADQESRSVLFLRGGVGTDVRSPDAGNAPSAFALLQNYPNPFNPATVIETHLPVASMVRLAVYDVLGREVAVLVSERRAAGTYHETFNGAGLASGVYFYTLRAGGFLDTKKFVLMK